MGDPTTHQQEDKHCSKFDQHYCQLLELQFERFGCLLVFQNKWAGKDGKHLKELSIRKMNTSNNKGKIDLLTWYLGAEQDFEAQVTWTKSNALFACLCSSMSQATIARASNPFSPPKLVSLWGGRRTSPWHLGQSILLSIFLRLPTLFFGMVDELLLLALALVDCAALMLPATLLSLQPNCWATTEDVVDDEDDNVNGGAEEDEESTLSRWYKLAM